MNIFEKIEDWWQAERLDRFEAETSQDMCPRNGDVVMMVVVMSAPISIPTVVVTILHFVFGIPWTQML